MLRPYHSYKSDFEKIGGNINEKTAKRIISAILTISMLFAMTTTTFAEDLSTKCGVTVIEKQYLIDEEDLINEFAAYEKGQFAYDINGKCKLSSIDLMELQSKTVYGNESDIWREYAGNIVEIIYDSNGIVIYAEELSNLTRATKTYKKSVQKNVMVPGAASTIKFTATFFYDSVQNYYEVIDTNATNTRQPNMKEPVTIDYAHQYYTSANPDPSEVIAYYDFTVIGNNIDYSWSIDAFI